MNILRTGFALAALLFVVSAQAADLACPLDKTIEDCADQLVFQQVGVIRTQLDPKAANALVADAANEAAEKNQAGAATAGGKTGSTITDLLPWLNVMGLVSDSDASDGTVALDLNFLLPIQNRENTKHNSQLKWAFDVSPEPFEPLIAAVPEDVREARKKQLQERISDTADSELQYTYSVVNKSLGRDFRRQSARLSALIWPAISASIPEDNSAALAAARVRFAMSLTSLLDRLRVNKIPGDDKSLESRNDVKNKLMRDFSTDDQRKLINAFVNNARDDLAVEMAKDLNSISRAAAGLSLDTLTKLVLLQPQLTFSVNKQVRSELVGPEAWGLKVSYERSFVSLNDFFREAGADCKSVADYTGGTAVKPGEAVTCLRRATEYMEAHAEDIEDENRIIGSLEYKQVDRWRFALPDDEIDLDRPKYDRIVGSIGYGRAVRRSAAKDRVDFEASYDSNLDDDDNYKSRFVVSLTYTRRFGDMDLPLSIVYANKSEFLEGVDKQIGLHFGVKFRALDKE